MSSMYSLLTRGPTSSSMMAAFARFPRRRGIEFPSATPSFLSFLHKKVFVLVCLCLLTVCVNSVYTTAETAPAAPLSSWNFYSRLLYILAATSCTNTPMLDPLVLSVFGVRWDWPDPYVELRLQELEHAAAKAAAGSDDTVRNVRIEEAVRRARVDRLVRDLAADDTELSEENSKDDGTGPIERELRYTPISSDTLFDKLNVSLPTSADGAKEVYSNNPHFEIGVFFPAEKRGPQREPQSRLDDEPKPWAAALEKEKEEEIGVEEKRENRLGLRSSVGGGNDGKAADVFLEDSGNDTEDKAIAGEAHVDTDSETDSPDARGFDNERSISLGSAAAIQPSTTTSGDAAELVKKGRGTMGLPRDKETAALDSTDRLLAEAQNYIRKALAVQEASEKQWTAPKREQGAEEVVEETELSTEDEEYGWENDEGSRFEDDEEEDSLMADDIRGGMSTLNEDGEKLTSDDHTSPGPPQGPSRGGIAAKDIASRMHAPETERKVVRLQRQGEMRVAAQGASAMTRHSSAQVPHASAEHLERLPVPALNQDQAAERIPLIKEEKNFDAAALRLGRESSGDSSLVQASTTDDDQITPTERKSGAASAPAVGAGVDGDEQDQSKMSYEPLPAAGRSGVDHNSRYANADSGVGERREHDADASTVEGLAASLHASGDKMSVRIADPILSKHLSPHASTATIAEVTVTADRPNVQAEAAIYVKTDLGPAADATGIRTHATGSRTEEADIITERVALDDSFVAVKSFASFSNSPQGKIVDAATLISRPVLPAVPIKATSLLVGAVGSSAAELLMRPLVRGTPSFIGAAAAVPPPALTTAAGLFAAATAHSHISIGASPAAPVGGSPVIAFAAAAHDANQSKGCKKMTVRERLRMMFDERLDTELLSLVRKSILKPGRGGVMKGDIAQIAGASRDENEEEKGTHRSSSEHGPSVLAAERRLPVKQQGEATRQTIEKTATPTATDLGPRGMDSGVPSVEDTLTKMLKDAAASMREINALATEAVETREGGSQIEEEKHASPAAPVTTGPQVEKRPFSVAAGRGGSWQRVEDEKSDSASHGPLTNRVLTQPGVQQQHEQVKVPSSGAAEPAKQAITEKPKGAAYTAPAGIVPASQTIPDKNEPLDDDFITGRLHLPSQQQGHQRSPSFQHLQPTTNNTPQRQPFAQEEPRRDAYQQNPQLPVRLQSDQKHRVDQLNMDDSTEEKEQSQPTVEPSSAFPQRVRDPPKPQPERTEETLSEIDTNNKAGGPTNSTHPVGEVELPYQLSHELEKSRSQQAEQQDIQKEEEEQAQVGETSSEILEEDKAELIQQRGELVNEDEEHVSHTEPEEISLWRDIEWRAGAYDRERGVSMHTKTASVSRCMSGNKEKCLDAVLERHCDSWCTAEAVKTWNGMRPVWTFVHFTPIPAYWNCMKDGLYGIFDEHRPAMEEGLRKGLRELNKLRIQTERHAKQLLELAAARSQEFQKQYPDLWLAAAWTIAVLLVCRILTGRFFFLLQLLLSAMAYTFCCRRRTSRNSEVNSAALATVNALLDDGQIKWLLTQTRKTSFLCECIRGRLLDGSLASPRELDSDPTDAELAAAVAEEGTGATGNDGVLAGILGYSARNIDAGQHEGMAPQPQQLQTPRVLQQIIRQQREVAEALRGVQQRMESVEMGQRLYETKLQEAAASHSAMFETNSLQQVDTNFALMNLTMRLLQKIDPEIAAESADQLQKTFLAHTDAINETVAAIKARQLRALFGRRRAQDGRDAQAKASTAAAGQPDRIGASVVGPPLPPSVASATSILDIPAPRPTSGPSFTVAGPLPPPTAMHLTASASVSISSGPVRTFPYSATAGMHPPPAAGIDSLVSPSIQHRLDSLQQSTDAFALSPLDKTEKHIPWLMRQLCNIQRSLPGLLVQRGEFHARLVLTRKVGDTYQQIELSPEKATFNQRSDSLHRALGPISAAVDRFLAGDIYSGESSTFDGRDLQSSPPTTAPDAECSRRVFPAEFQQATAEDKKDISLDAATEVAGPPSLAAATPPLTRNTLSNDPESMYLPNGDVEQKADKLAEEPAAETLREPPAELSSLPPPPAGMTRASSSLTARDTLGTGEKLILTPPPKKDAPRRSAADLFADPAEDGTANRGAGRLSLETFFSESRVISHPAEKAENTPNNNDYPGMPTPPKTLFLACPPLTVDGSAAAAAPAAFTPHFPPGDASAFESEQSATAVLLPSAPSSSTCLRPAAAVPPSLLSSPFTGPAVAACPPSQSTDLFPPLSDAPPPSGSPPSTSMLTSDEAGPAPKSSMNAVPSLHESGVASSADPSSTPFLPGQSESGNPPLLNALTGVAAAPGILPSPPSARSFIAAAAATSAATSPFAHERKGSGVGIFPVTPPPPTSSPFGVVGAPAGLDSRRDSQDDTLMNNGVSPPAASIPPPPPSAFSQQQMINATEGMNSIALGTELQPPQHMGGGINGGTPPPPFLPPPPMDSPPPPPAEISTPTHFAPPPPPPPPPSQQVPLQYDDGPFGAAEAAELCEGGSMPATPLAFTSTPGTFCSNGTPTLPLLSVPRRMSGSFPPTAGKSVPPPTEALTPTKPTTAYQRPSRFQRERREPVKIQATTNPFAVRPPASANLQQFGGGASPSNDAA